MIFKDRIEAAKLLANKLSKYKDEPGVVMAVPKGGVPLAYIVAKELDFPMQIIFTKKIGHPTNKEYAIGAASLTDYFVEPHHEVSREYIEQELKLVRAKLQGMADKFSGKYDTVDLKEKTVLIIDDGMATGNTLLSTVQLLRKSYPAKIVIAVPVASIEAVDKLKNKVDELLVLHIPSYFESVGSFYENFDNVSEDDVLSYLEKMKGRI